jgi:hypothetical protein
LRRTQNAGKNCGDAQNRQAFEKLILKELDVVKIAKFLREDRDFDGTENVKRPPRIGDIGTIVHLDGKFCIVENVDSDGYTAWLADFLMEELEIYE